MYYVWGKLDSDYSFELKIILFCEILIENCKLIHFIQYVIAKLYSGIVIETGKILLW